jgi:hypothetical protein
MRRRTSVAIALVCLCAAPAARATPGDVYNDFAQDGVLSCNHPRSDLTATLRSGSINQYGDPYTLARLKLTIRRQLAGGCRRRSTSSGGKLHPTGGGTTGTTAHPGGTGSAQTRNQRNAKHSRRQAEGTSEQRPALALSAADNSGFIWRRVVLLAVLLGALAVGGWLTRRGLAARH